MVARIPLTSAAFFVAVAGAACGGTYGEEGEDPFDPPAFPDGTGQTPSGTIAYPSGPFGVNVGDTIQNFQFSGLPNPARDSQTLLPIQLADFYNPTGEGVYPEGHPLFPGERMPVALLVNVGAVWCGPCNHEADVVLPPLYAEYHPRGAQFLFQLAEGATPGVVATLKNLQAWTKKYEVDYPSTIDASYALGALFDPSSFPANLVVDTRTMRIVAAVSGAPEAGSGLWLKLEALLLPP